MLVICGMLAMKIAVACIPIQAFKTFGFIFYVKAAAE